MKSLISSKDFLQSTVCFTWFDKIVAATILRYSTGSNNYYLDKGEVLSIYSDGFLLIRVKVIGGNAWVLKSSLERFTPGTRVDGWNIGISELNLPEERTLDNPTYSKDQLDKELSLLNIAEVPFNNEFQVE